MLKPVMFVRGRYSFNKDDAFRDAILLKALTITKDPKELRKMIGVKAVSDVYRTLDKMQIRREYHEALANSGITFDSIVLGLKDIAENSSSDAVRLKTYGVIMKSIGIDKYDKDDVSSVGWEEALLKARESLPSGAIKEHYDVIQPVVPEDELRAIESEKVLASKLYGSPNKEKEVVQYSDIYE